MDLDEGQREDACVIDQALNVLLWADWIDSDRDWIVLVGSLKDCYEHYLVLFV